jgi:hypothetical protein
MATAILFPRNEVGQTEARQPTSLALPRPEGLPCPVMATATLALSQGSMAYSRHNRLGNDDPDLVRHLGGWGTEVRGRALAGRTGPDLSKPDGGVNGSR